MDVQTEGDPLMEGQLRLPGTVDIHRLLGLHVTFLMVYTGLNHTITDRLEPETGSDTHTLQYTHAQNTIHTQTIQHTHLSHYELCILRTVQLKLLSDVGQ